MKLRPYRSDDCSAILQLFHDTIHEVNAQDYTPEQLGAWAPPVANLNAADWHASLAAHYTLVAEQDGHVIGFADLDGDYFDRLYVHKNCLRRGVASMLADALEAHAREMGVHVISVHASLTAHDFFARRGYLTVTRQTVICRGVAMDNYIMKKTLLS